MKNTKEYYITLLCETAKREGRLPRKSDFSVEDVNCIKGFFGPWPWALEAAGLKESKQDERRAKNREKRLRSKQRRKENNPSQSFLTDERKQI